MAVLMMSAVVAVVAAHWLQSARRPANTGSIPEEQPEVFVSPVPTEFRPARVSSGVLDSSTVALDVTSVAVPIDEILETNLGPDDLPPLITPSTVGPSSAGAPADDDLVVGVVVEEIPRAYPLSVLNYHWVVNDIIEGRSVVVFWDPVAGAAMAYRPVAKYQRLQFGASGLFFQGNGLFCETDTTSLLVPLMGSFVTGKLAGERLEALPSWRETWSTWVERWPESRVLSTDTGYERPYHRDPFTALQAADGETVDYFATSTMLVRPTRTDPEERLHPKEWVLGFLTPEDEAYCCALRDLPKDEDESGAEVGGVRVARLPAGGAQAELPGEVWPQQAICFYFAWFGAYPETLVWSSAEDEEAEW